MESFTIGKHHFQREEKLPEITLLDDRHYVVEIGERLIEVFEQDGGLLSDGFAFDAVEVAVETERERLISERFSATQKAKVGAGNHHIVKAPMPGLVKKILAKQGDPVTKETPIIILEAMKMENILTAGFTGKVSGIKTEEGKNVEKNAPLAEIE